MYPSIDYFGKHISTYALMAGIGIILGLFYVIISLRKDKTKQDNAMYIYGLGIIGALLGAKLFYILTVLPDFIADLGRADKDGSLFISKYISAGWVFYGGMILGLLFAWLAAKMFKTKLSLYTKELVPAVIIFAGLGRIGCFLGGCCYGIEADTPISVVFPPESQAPSGIPLIPTQLIEAFCDLAILIVILIYNRRCENTGRQARPLTLYILLYSIMRFTLEFLRGDAIRGGFLFFSTSQWIAICLALGVILINTHPALKEKI